MDYIHVSLIFLNLYRFPSYALTCSKEQGYVVMSHLPNFLLICYNTVKFWEPDAKAKAAG
jgi:hypothetical protein